MRFKWSILVTTILVIALVHSCGTDDTKAREDINYVETGDEKVLGAFPPSVHSGADEFGASYDHYFICLYQNMFAAAADNKSKTLIARTIGQPQIEACLIDGFSIPIIEGQYFNYEFSSGTNQVFNGADPAAALEIEKMKDIPIEISTAEKISSGKFPTIDHLMEPQISADTEDRLRRDGNTVLTWKPDDNYDGVVVIQLWGTSIIPDNLHTKNIVADDSGSYAFTREDFEGFPANARVNVAIMKGNYGITSDRVFFGSLVIFFDEKIYILLD